MDKRDIDRTHIIALKEVNGLFQNVEIPIRKPEQFIAELNAMIENPNRTVWDMQSLFVTRYPKTNVRMIDYIYPHSYSASYVGCTVYPELKDYSDLTKSWQEAAKIARDSYIDGCKDQHTQPNPQEIARKESEAIANRKKNQKTIFIVAANKWINASCYQEEARLAMLTDDVKMFSKENIGWNTFTHRVNEDVEVELRTNFGYGNSAYFLLAVRYKGIAILPYSYIVKYYKAGMADLVRCTRKYQTVRESWCAAFDFLSDFVNQSIANPGSFVKEYIMGEVEEMMNGLDAISRNPKLYIDTIKNKNGEHLIVNVRKMFDDEKTRMATYPTEMPILFKVEKITGALDFLDSLTEVSNVVADVNRHIEHLLEINMGLLPEIKDAIKNIGTKIELENGKKKVLETEISHLSALLEPYEAEMVRLRKQLTSAQFFSISDYEKTHPEYVKLKDEKSNTSSRLYKVNRTINDFNSFLEVLENSKLKINKLKVTV